jgi:hypothetical protein
MTFAAPVWGQRDLRTDGHRRLLTDGHLNAKGDQLPTAAIAAYRHIPDTS